MTNPQQKTQTSIPNLPETNINPYRKKKETKTGIHANSSKTHRNRYQICKTKNTENQCNINKQTGKSMPNAPTQKHMQIYAKSIRAH